jgi:ABC-2 type transport system ATP-binding protein
VTGSTVELVGVTRRFRSTVALDDVSFELRPGEVLGLLGPNGAGKTTSMRVLTGCLRPTSGRVVVDGADLWDDPVAHHARIGYMPESSALYPDMTVEGYLGYWARLRKVPRAKRAAAVARTIARTGLRAVAHRRIATLSRGYRQRVGLAQAVLHDPPVLVLDEPTAGLDPRQVAEARELIAKLGRTRAVLFSSHLLSEVAELCRRVVVLDRGRVVAVDDVAALTAPVGPSRLDVRVAREAERAAGAVRALAGVTRVDVKGDRLLVEGEGSDLAERVSGALVASGIGLVELSSRSRSTLEDAYLRLVGD